MVLLVAMGREPCSAATGAYCKARAKLPERLLRRLTYQVGAKLDDQAPDDWRWLKRRVLLVDGTTVTLADTPPNQRAYPQARTQKKGLGDPILRLVVLLTYATAGVVGAACRAYALNHAQILGTEVDFVKGWRLRSGGDRATLQEGVLPGPTHQSLSNRARKPARCRVEQLFRRPNEA
jgi:hypothetical protein